MPQRIVKIPFLTCVFLILLRLAIGWHFFIEGTEKVESVNAGVTETSKPFTSAGYLRESSGPLSGFFHWQAGGDPDEQALALFDVKPLAEGQDPARVPYHERIPPALDQDWDEYLQRFANHYKLDDSQRQEAKGKLDQSKERAVRWLLGLEGTKEVENNDFPTATYKVKETPAQRIAGYKDKVQEIRRVEDKELPAFLKDVYKQKLRTLKAEAAHMRAELLADLNRLVQEDLESVLTPEQKRLGPVKDEGPTSPADWAAARAEAAMGRGESVPPVPPRVAWVDWAVPWGLVVIGACLLLGLLSRPASFLGAVFLLMLYLAMPPWPWLPENLRVEGHYLFVNKNLIEMLALLVLATVPTGRWFGLDGLLQFLNPWRRRSARAEPGANGQPAGRVGAPSLQT
jgi:uncharacterized membrane protein YphA (DoxX/SURF4 family)